MWQSIKEWFIPHRCSLEAIKEQSIRSTKRGDGYLILSKCKECNELHASILFAEGRYLVSVSWAKKYMKLESL